MSPPSPGAETEDGWNGKKQKLEAGAEVEDGSTYDPEKFSLTFHALPPAAMAATGSVAQPTHVVDNPPRGPLLSKSEVGPPMSIYTVAIFVGSPT